MRSSGCRIAASRRARPYEIKKNARRGSGAANDQDRPIPYRPIPDPFSCGECEVESAQKHSRKYDENRHFRDAHKGSSRTRSGLSRPVPGNSAVRIRPVVQLESPRLLGSADEFVYLPPSSPVGHIQKCSLVTMSGRSRAYSGPSPSLQ